MLDHGFHSGSKEDQSGKWAVTNMPKLDGVDGATNYSNNGGSSWAISSNCAKDRPGR